MTTPSLDQTHDSLNDSTIHICFGFNHSPSVKNTTYEINCTSCIKTDPEALEDVFMNRTVATYDDTDMGSEGIQFRTCVDGHLLKCADATWLVPSEWDDEEDDEEDFDGLQRNIGYEDEVTKSLSGGESDDETPPLLQSLFGILEKYTTVDVENPEDKLVKVRFYEVTNSNDMKMMAVSKEKTGGYCVCRWNPGNWIRKGSSDCNDVRPPPAAPPDTKQSAKDDLFSSWDYDSTTPPPAQARPPASFSDWDYDESHPGCSPSNIHVSFIDIRYIQSHNPELFQPCRIYHFLRSLLQCRSVSSSWHVSSPWGNRYSPQGQGQTYCQNCVQGVLMSYSNAQEREQILNLVKFRTGDANPSFYLHAVVHLQSTSNSASFWEDVIFDIETEQADKLITSTGLHTLHQQPQQYFVLLVYRHLPPRIHLTKTIPNDKPPPQNPVNDDGCLWEAFEPPPSLDEAPPEQPPQILYRKVAPPYYSIKHEYPHVQLQNFLTPQNLHQIQQEALKIKQWAAWPETQHYSENDNWSVFPLCYTFPAHDITKRTWVDKTCDFVPHTTHLIRSICGNEIRTALFSKLGPQTTLLEAHTGWSDLANFVLRVHIPIVVPAKLSNTVSGLWVDGCVEYHTQDDIVCFDDSKTHRAFYYAEEEEEGEGEERIVLILDLIRPNGLPFGYATGDHTDELDGFIKDFLS